MIECVSKSSKNAVLLNLSKTSQLSFEVTLLCRFESYTIFFLKPKSIWENSDAFSVLSMLLDFSSALSMPSLSCKTRITKEEKLFLQKKQQKRDRKYISNEI